MHFTAGRAESSSHCYQNDRFPLISSIIFGHCFLGDLRLLNSAINPPPPDNHLLQTRRLKYTPRHTKARSNQSPPSIIKCRPSTITYLSLSLSPLEHHFINILSLWLGDEETTTTGTWIRRIYTSIRPWIYITKL